MQKSAFDCCSYKRVINDGVCYKKKLTGGAVSLVLCSFTFWIVPLCVYFSETDAAYLFVLWACGTVNGFDVFLYFLCYGC